MAEQAAGDAGGASSGADHARDDAGSPEALRQQALDKHAALVMHVELVRELMAERDAMLTRSAGGAPDGGAADAARERASLALRRATAMRVRVAALGMLERREVHATARVVLAHWRNHCEKAQMLRNMRTLTGVVAAPPAAAPEPREREPVSPDHTTSGREPGAAGAGAGAGAVQPPSPVEPTARGTPAPSAGAPPAPLVSRGASSAGGSGGGDGWRSAHPPSPGGAESSAVGRMLGSAISGWAEKSAEIPTAHDEAVMQKLKHLTVENGFLRERTELLETSMQQANLSEISARDLGARSHRDTLEMSPRSWPEGRTRI